MIATLSGMVASLFAVFNLYTMLHEMGQVPRLKGNKNTSHCSLSLAWPSS